MKEWISISFTAILAPVSLSVDKDDAHFYLKGPSWTVISMVKELCKIVVLLSCNLFNIRLTKCHLLLMHVRKTSKTQIYGVGAHHRLGKFSNAQ